MIDDDMVFTLQDIYRNTLPVTTSQQQKLRVCEICGAYLSLYDNDRRYGFEIYTYYTMLLLPCLFKHFALYVLIKTVRYPGAMYV